MPPAPPTLSHSHHHRLHHQHPTRPPAPPQPSQQQHTNTSSTVTTSTATITARITARFHCALATPDTHLRLHALPRFTPQVLGCGTHSDPTSLSRALSRERGQEALLHIWLPRASCDLQLGEYPPPPRASHTHKGQFYCRCTNKGTNKGSRAPPLQAAPLCFKGTGTTGDSVKGPHPSLQRALEAS